MTRKACLMGAAALASSTLLLPSAHAHGDLGAIGAMGDIVYLFIVPVLVLLTILAGVGVSWLAKRAPSRGRLIVSLILNIVNSLLVLLSVVTLGFMVWAVSGFGDDWIFALICIPSGLVLLAVQVLAWVLYAKAKRGLGGAA